MDEMYSIEELNKEIQKLRREVESVEESNASKGLITEQINLEIQRAEEYINNIQKEIILNPIDPSRPKREQKLADPKVQATSSKDAFKKWEKTPIAGVSLVSGRVGYFERKIIGKEVDHVQAASSKSAFTKLGKATNAGGSNDREHLEKLKKEIKYLRCHLANAEHMNSTKNLMIEKLRLRLHKLDEHIEKIRESLIHLPDHLKPKDAVSPELSRSRHGLSSDLATRTAETLPQCSDRRENSEGSSTVRERINDDTTGTQNPPTRKLLRKGERKKRSTKTANMGSAISEAKQRTQNVALRKKKEKSKDFIHYVI